MIRAGKSIFSAVLIAAVACLPRASAAKGPQVSVPPATQPTLTTRVAIPPDELQAIYRFELGEAYRRSDGGKLLAAHDAIERYFSDDTPVERAKVVAELEGSGLDVATLARLTRVRKYWPALKGGGVYYTNERHGASQVRYFLGVPESYNRSRPWPLVVMLPTANAFLTEPPPSADDVVQIYTAWIKDELARHPDALVLMPLLNLDEVWGPSYAGMYSAMQPILHAGESANIDVSRVYLVGHGMSAHAVWNLGVHFPTYFAAINPLAGSASGDWQRLRLMNLRNVLPVVWHDDSDNVVRVAIARSLVKQLQALKLDVVYDETREVGHAPTPQIIEKAYQTFRKRNRQVNPKEVWLQSNRLDTAFNRVDWVQVYQPIQPGKEKRMLFGRGSGMMRLYAKSWKVQATVSAPNRIEATTDNVATLRFYLSPEQFDFRKPVTVIVNKKGQFEAMVKPSVSDMLKDQVFLGRGWRDYAAKIDIELVPSPTTSPSTRTGTR